MSSYQTIPDEVLDKIVAHRPRLAILAHNVRNATSAGGARQIEKALACAYLSAETHLSPIETCHLAACTNGSHYGHPAR